MEITFTQPAIKWFKNEMDLEEGDYLRFFVRYGGHSSIQPGFSLGISMQDEPYEPLAKREIDGIIFFIEKKDQWYFKNNRLHVKYSRKRDEIEFITD
ncbi:Uncharacterized protein YneR [Pelagirhabdus alkalitolerans]|uniref:Uncharacterized protein YneR n=1 Tax=Pelagirhabdus alkalitolerans TaxID=1612202 RepID=A0A1G6GKF4_9BACI|nr:HesB/YadR/YfhF family protein [Pelagirhabdus alkalitolerans]SDB82512.1 Uncharacterized protein YneR [Pelagirhabdus alkalitolerans]